ncbi:MAG: carboxypeptidase regulatory-like domain-containing protein [Planctomycetota bacterium]|nr:carboxypeptidase regulatory-like domain-containing protein [Planctomycetota bacterium]MDA1214287.1 carboxypeptidase regulatory-like domain-containing protein [Planctomycetota bacterium]
MKLVYSCLFLLTTLILSGCGGGGSGDLPELGQVSGTITLDDKPLAGAQVEFASEKARSSTAQTDAEGKYTLMYDHENKGAAVGNHKVRITTGMFAAGSDVAKGATTTTIPEKYNINTELTAEVVAGENTFDFKLTSQ